MSLVAALLLAAGTATAGRGTIAIWDRAATGPAPDWARPCLRRAPRDDRILLARCARASGRVVWVRHRGAEVHFALVTRFHLFVVKGGPAPAVGDAKVVLGPLVRGRNGLREIEAVAVPDA